MMAIFFLIQDHTPTHCVLRRAHKFDILFTFYNLSSLAYFLFVVSWPSKNNDIELKLWRLKIQDRDILSRCKRSPLLVATFQGVW